MKDRRTRARDWRIQAAEQEFERPVAAHVNNGEESDYPFAGNYSKGLPHDEFGDVDPAAYRLLLRAVTTGAAADFEAIPLGGSRPLTNPQSGLGLDTEGPDPAALAIPPAPRIDSPRNSSEAAELYWMALARDVPFTDFASSALIAEAAEDLSGFSDFRGPKAGGRVTPGTLFRGTTRGDLRGPYVSQFLLRDIPYGTLLVRQQIDTVAPTDWLTSFDDWLAVQNGAATPAERRDLQHRTFLHTPRDLAHYVHFDALYEAYLNACLILLGLDAPVDAGNPYTFSRNQVGFGTYGPPHVLSLVTEVATRALKAIWYQKWFVHRRLRPEEFGGRVHLRLTGARDFPIDPEILDSVVVKRTFDTFGSYLLPQAFPEGSPTHPAYGSGHATVAGACVTVLKAWFDESFVLPDPVQSSRDGSALVPYTGADAGTLTVGGELNKLAANIANARNIAGVHWRTDFSEAVLLGEQVALGVLRELVESTHERASFTINLFDGTTTTI